MKSLKLETRLELGIGSIMMLVLGIAFKEAETPSESKDFANTQLKNLYINQAQIREVSYLALDSARIVRNLIFNKEPEAIVSNKNQYEKNSSRIDELIRKLDATSKQDEDVQFMNNIKNARKVYNEYNVEMMELAMKEGASDASAKVLDGSKYQLQAELLQSLRDLVDDQQKQIEEMVEEAKNADSSGLVLARLIIAFLIFMMIVAADLLARWLFENYAQSSIEEMNENPDIS